MKIYQVVQEGATQEYTSLPEALREAAVAGVRVVTVDRADVNRRYSMSRVPAPEDYRWHHHDLGEQDGDGIVATNDDGAKSDHRRIRREWLSQFPMSVSDAPEGGYRYWRWTDPADHIVWWERRPWATPIPHEPGFWPS